MRTFKQVAATAVAMAIAAPVFAQNAAKPSDNYDELVKQYLTSARATAAAPATPDTLWMAGLNGDLRARRVNDLVTVRVVEVVSAQGSADSSLDKNSSASASLTNFFGVESKLPVSAPSNVANYHEPPQALEHDQIAEVVEHFARSAGHAAAGGFDGIEVHGAHGYLIHEFLSPRSNRRTDEYGGSLENRMRAPLKFISAVRKAVGKDFTLGIRMCADEMIPGGLDLAQVQEICARFEASGLIDFMDLSIATFYNLYLVEGSMHTPLGYTIPLAAGIREKIKLPVFCTGRINDPVMAEKVLANGQADMIGMCRGLICDPFMPKKAFEGRLEDIRYCVADNQGCIGRIGMNKTLGCIQNPAIGREQEWGEGTLEKAAVKKKVMGVGGGPGGLWAAKMAGRRGHDVTLYDKNEALGGQVLTAMKGAGRDEFGVIIRNEKGQVEKTGATVKLGVEVTTEQVLAENPDVVIVATGSLPKEHPVGGADGPAVYNVWQVLNGEAQLGEKVCLIDYDGHHRATATAEYLANLGKKVHIITSSLFIGAELGPTQDLYLTRQRLLQKGATFTPDIAVMEVAGEAGAKTVKGFNVYSNVCNEWGSFDAIVLAMGQRVENSFYVSLKGKVKELY